MPYKKSVSFFMLHTTKECDIPTLTFGGIPLIRDDHSLLKGLAVY